MMLPMWWREFIADLRGSAIALLMVGAYAAASESMTVLLASLERVPLQVETLDETTLRGSDSSGRERTVALAELLAMDRFDAAPRAGRERLVLHVAGGLQLPGVPRAMGEETLAWSSDLLGEVAVPVSLIERVQRGSGRPLQRSAAEDVLQLANGDRVRGAIVVADSNSVSVQTPAGELSVEWGSIVAMSLAAAEGAKETGAPAAYRVTLADGAVWEMQRLSIAAGQVMLTPRYAVVGEEPSRPLALPLAQLVSLERIGGAATWLARLKPASVTATPFLGRGATAPALTVGGPLRLGDGHARTFVRMHPRCRASYAVPAGAQRLHTRVAQQREGVLADATVRILLDGKVAHEQAGVRSTSPGEAMEIALGSAREVALEVDYGENYDVEDAVLWLDPLLLGR
jgi:phage FluMu protein gp41